MTRKLLVVVLAVALAAACAPEGKLRVLTADELPSDIYASPSPTPTAAPPRRIAVYFVRGEHLEWVAREAPRSAELAEFVVRVLLEGPTPEEQAAGIRTAIPEGAELLELSVSDRTASVNLSKEFELSAEQRVLVLRLGQVVFTLTELARVRNVRFLIDGEPVGVVAPDGTTREVVGRSDYAQLRQPQSTDVPAEPSGGEQGS